MYCVFYGQSMQKQCACIDRKEREWKQITCTIQFYSAWISLCTLASYNSYSKSSKKNESSSLGDLTSAAVAIWSNIMYIANKSHVFPIPLFSIYDTVGTHESK